MSVDEGLKAFQYIFFYPNISFWLQAVENHYRDHIYIQNYIILVVQMKKWTGYLGDMYVEC